MSKNVKIAFKDSMSLSNNKLVTVSQFCTLD